MDTVETDIVHKRIIYIARIKGKTLYKVATDGGMERNAIYNMIKRGSMPTLPILGKICKGLDVSLKDFFDENVELKPESDQQMTDDDCFLIEIFHSIPERDNRKRFIGYAEAYRDLVNKEYLDNHKGS